MATRTGAESLRVTSPRFWCPGHSINGSLIDAAAGVARRLRRRRPGNTNPHGNAVSGVMNRDSGGRWGSLLDSPTSRVQLYPSTFLPQDSTFLPLPLLGTASWVSARALWLDFQLRDRSGCAAGCWFLCNSLGFTSFHTAFKAIFPGKSGRLLCNLRRREETAKRRSASGASPEAVCRQSTVVSRSAQLYHQKS